MSKEKFRYAFTMLIITIIGGILIFSERLPTILRCPFKFITGLPCPGCGMTRATLSLFKGDMLSSFYYNPLAIPVDLSIIIYVH